MKKTLFFNTATQLTSIALFKGSEVMVQKSWASEQNESQTLMPAVQELLKELTLSSGDIDQVLVCIGPGGFTSCRIGVSAANAWSFAKQVPVAACSVFDLYDQSKGESLLLSANPQEAWFKKSNDYPEFIHAEEMPELSGVISGAINDDWLDIFQEMNVVVDHQDQGLPNPEQFDYQEKSVMPWYFKDPNITWSKKNVKLKTENEK